MVYGRLDVADKAKAVHRADWVAAWGSAFLALLVFSGQVKAAPFLSWLPLDLTLVTAVLVGVAVVVSRVRLGPAHPLVLLPLAFWLVLAIPMSYAPPEDQEKVATLFTVTLLIAVAPFYLLRTVQQRRTFLVAAGVLGTIAAMAVVTSGSTVDGYNSRFILEGSDSIGTARLAGSGAIVCTLLALQRGPHWMWRVALAAAGVGLLVLAFASGSRGPVAAGAAAILCTAVLSGAFRRYRLRVLVGAVVAGAIAVSVASTQSADGFNRIARFFTGEAAGATYTRELLNSEAWQLTAANPGGIGWGTFRLGTLTYPHNVYVEVPMEAGWLAGVVLLALVAVAAGRYMRMQNDRTQVIMFALFVFAVINAAVSSDINGNRLLWLMLFAAFAVPVRQMKSATSSPDARPAKRDEATRSRSGSAPSVG